MSRHIWSAERWLWFDVEQGYKTMNTKNTQRLHRLWFDVEQGYKTINTMFSRMTTELWFDVEQGYKTIR